MFVRQRSVESGKDDNGDAMSDDSGGTSCDVYRRTTGRVRVRKGNVRQHL